MVGGVGICSGVLDFVGERRRGSGSFGGRKSLGVSIITNEKFDGWLCGSGLDMALELLLGVVGRVNCLSGVRSCKLREITRDISLCYRRSWSLSKNLTSDFAPELAKYTKCSPKSPNTPKWGFGVRCTLPQHAPLAPPCVVVNHNGPQAFQWSQAFCNVSVMYRYYCKGA